MDIRDIRYFLKVAEYCHLGRAAEELHISQPALSKCISRLEQSYGVQLFDRVGRRIALTESGQLLRERYQLLQQDLQEIQREVSSYRSGIAGVVRVGCAASIASFVLPDVCRSMQEKAPDLRLQIRVAMDDVLQEALRAGAIDITISPHRTDEPDDAIVSNRLLSDTVVVVARRGHPLAGRQSSLREMSEFGWVLPTPSVSTRQWLDAVFVKAGLPQPETIISASPLVAAPAITVKTDLLSFMSRRNLQVGEIEEVENAATTLHRFFDIAHRARSFMSPAARYLIALLEREVEMIA
ncbi:LysR family transcriptional regulator [Rhizobium sp. P32RR-XVIII]|uniref:LysR family transcriptional regulator n=1 Tax=Rhizobium sp. P32RR-XVIII TaxID=2726738 RepID=UPI00145700A9|nr:LysR family transcriptional regulator [Rhizobium sp. P32RR-XVIII]NLS06864.1 LysR family transcriptional regulator [Rhizobium sp. P32RR-XVIII]